MLPAKYRLIKDADFKKTQRLGQSYSGQLLQLRVRESGRETTRIGFVVGLRFSKKASVRNRAKRQLREAFGQLLPHLRHGLEIIVMPKWQGSEKISGKSVQMDADQIVKKNQLIIKK